MPLNKYIKAFFVAIFYIAGIAVTPVAFCQNDQYLHGFAFIFVGMAFIMHLSISHHNKLKQLIMQNQSELAAALNTITDQLTKIGSETKTLLQKITDLETAVGSQPNVTQELQDAFDKLKAQASIVDELVPDAPTA